MFWLLALAWLAVAACSTCVGFHLTAAEQRIEGKKECRNVRDGEEEEEGG